MTKNVNIDKYRYSRYEIGFDRRSSFSFPDRGFGHNVLIFGVDMSFSTHVDNNNKDILVLGKGPTQGLEHTLTAEKCIQLILQKKNKKFCLSLHYNGEIVTYLLMVQKFTNLKLKILKLLQLYYV